MKAPKWPEWLYIVRHGQSAGNVARDVAELAGLAMIDIDQRDVDVPLSELGQKQAKALGQWISELPPDRRPEVLLTSPYARAVETAEICRAEFAGHNLPLIHDERLREREFGILDRLTKTGIIERYPEQNLFRIRLGKFYYRPPGGESWTDVLLRLRSFIEMMVREYHGQRVMIICHSVVVLCFRYLLERLSEAEILKIDQEQEVANCSVTTYQFTGVEGKHGKLLLKNFNYVAPVAGAGEKVTRRSDVPTN